MTPEELVGELAAKHGIKISAKDPVLVVAFLNELILAEQMRVAGQEIETRLAAFSREIGGHRKGIADSIQAVLGAADGEFGKRLAASVANSVDGSAKDARTKMQAVIESGRDQAMTSIGQMVSAAQQAAQDAAHARLWAVCAAGIALVVSVGLVVFALVPVLVRI